MPHLNGALTYLPDTDELFLMLENLFQMFHKDTPFLDVISDTHEHRVCYGHDVLCFIRKFF